MKFVASTCPQQLAGPAVLFESAEPSLPAGLLVAPCLVQVTHGTVYVPVVNVRMADVFLHPHTGLDIVCSAQVVSLPAGVTEVKPTTAPTVPLLPSLYESVKRIAVSGCA